MVCLLANDYFGILTGLGMDAQHSDEENNTTFFFALHLVKYFLFMINQTFLQSLCIRDLCTNSSGGQTLFIGSSRMCRTASVLFFL
jgi:hypothetical protein